MRARPGRIVKCYMGRDTRTGLVPGGRTLLEPNTPSAAGRQWRLITAPTEPRPAAPRGPEGVLSSMPELPRRTLARPRPPNGHAATAPHRACEPPVALCTWFSFVQLSELASSHAHRRHRRRMLRSCSHSHLVHTRRHPGTGVANVHDDRLFARVRSRPANGPGRSCG